MLWKMHPKTESKENEANEEIYDQKSNNNKNDNKQW